MRLRLVVLAAVAAPSFAPAQEPPPAAALEPIVVTATRSAQRENRLPAAVTVISRDEILKSGATHVVEVLRAAGGLQVTELFGDGSRASIDLRGFGEGAHSGTLILVDGRRLNNSDIAAPDLNSVPLKDIERIEIIQGSAGVLYGDQAVGGVINIVTRGVQDFVAALEGTGGNYGNAQARATLAQRLEAWSLRLSAEARTTDNYREHNAQDYGNALLRVGYDGAGTAVSIEGGWTDEDLQTPGALYADEMRANRRQSTGFFSEDFSDTRTALARVRWLQDVAEGWQFDADVDHRDSDGSFRLSSAVFGPATSDTAQTRRITGMHPRVVGNFAFGPGRGLLTAGIDGQQADYVLRSQFGVQSNEQRQLDVYAQAIAPVTGGLEATLGARTARVDNEVLDGFTFVVPTRFHDRKQAGEAGLAWQATEDTRLFARYDRNFRFAKVDEFTSAGAPPGSNNVNLRTQTGDSWEFGAQLAAGPAQLRATVYRLRIEDEIAFDPVSFTNVNLDHTQRDGLLLETDVEAGVWRLGARYHYIDADVRGGTFDGRNIPLAAKQTAKLIARADLPAGLTAYAELIAVDDRPFAGDFDNSLDRLPGYAVANLSLGWRAGAVGIDARVNNVLGREYAEYGAASLTNDGNFNETESYFPSPERNTRVSIRYDW
jgi:iron complex outermembrane receptor protein